MDRPGPAFLSLCAAQLAAEGRCDGSRRSSPSCASLGLSSEAPPRPLVLGETGAREAPCGVGMAARLTVGRAWLRAGLSGLEALGDLPGSASLCRPLLVSPHPSRCFHTARRACGRPVQGAIRGAPGRTPRCSSPWVWDEHLPAHTPSSWRGCDRLVSERGP